MSERLLVAQFAQAIALALREAGIARPQRAGFQGKKFATRSNPQQGADPTGEMAAFRGSDMEHMVAWGQSKRLDFVQIANPSLGYEQSAVSIVKNDLVQREDLEEPILRTFSCFVQPSCAQVGNDPTMPPAISEIADLPIVGRLIAAVGGNAQTIYFSWKNGTVITVPAMTWDVAAWIEPPAGMDFRTFLGKSVTVGATVSTMPHPGGTMVPTLDKPTLFGPLGG